MKTQKIIYSLLIILGICFSVSSEETNMDSAWQALANNDYEKAKNITNEYISKNINSEKKQQIRINAAARIDQNNTEMNNSAVNNLGIAHFIQAEIARVNGQSEEAKEKYNTIIENYTQSQCMDPRGWTWNVADVAADKIELLNTPYDYEDYKSETLVVKAWQALENNDYKGAELYANKCIKLYEKDAIKTEENIKIKNVSQDDKQWALNDVGTAYFILGEIYLKQGDNSKAKEMYKLATRYDFSKCFDPQGFYWKIKEVSEDKLNTIDTSYDFASYKSNDLVKKAWEALSQNDFKGVELYANKCIYLYCDKAIDMQNQLTSYAEDGFNPLYWALNDVATSYYILGESYKQAKEFEKAKEMYQTIINKYQFAQCFDPRGWYWKIDEACKKMLNELR